MNNSLLCVCALGLGLTAREGPRWGPDSRNVIGGTLLTYFAFPGERLRINEVRNKHAPLLLMLYKCPDRESCVL